MDQNMPVSGKDISVKVSVNGRSVKVIDQITNITAEVTQTQVEHKPLGTSRVHRFREPEGWSGTLEFAPNSPDLDELYDIIDAAARDNLPILISIEERTRYRNRRSKGYRYPDVKIGFSKNASRGQSATISVPWETGEARVAL